MPSTFSLYRWLACGLAATVASVAAPARAQDPVRDFNIASQPMGAALNAFSQQSGVPLLFPYDQVVALRSNVVTGRMPARTALAIMIRASGLKITTVDHGVIALTAPPG